jgi:hypothetical protein
MSDRSCPIARPPLPSVLYVCHGMYGCETGCCGYQLCEDDEGDKPVVGASFNFQHPAEGQNVDAFARRTWGGHIDLDGKEIHKGKWYPGDCNSDDANDTWRRNGGL